MTLDGLMFDHSLFSLFVDVFVRAKAYFLPHIFGVVVMHEVVKRGVFDFIVKRLTKNLMVLYE